MPIAPGTRLGSYEIVSLLGVGGMGEVYACLHVCLPSRIIRVPDDSRTIVPLPDDRREIVA